MKLILVLFILSGIIISGCIGDPTKQVPVVHVNMTIFEKDGNVDVGNYKLTQGMVNYLSRPRATEAQSFPAITARTMIVKGMNSSIGPWETLSYKGNGTYSFNIGFKENNYPVPEDKVHISIMVVVDTEGKQISYFAQDMIWE